MDNKIILPDAKEIVNKILNSVINYKGTEKTIKDLVKDYKDNIENRRKQTKDKIFFEFVTHLLARTSNEKWWDRITDWLNDEIVTLENVNESTITKEKLKSMGYRFHPAGVNVILESKNIFLQKYDGNWDNYFNIAESNLSDNFKEDYFLKIKNVKFKVRDLALSQFSTKFVAIDRHLVDILSRTGLICYCYPLHLELGTNVQDDNTYLSLRKLCVELSKVSGIEPGELDRTFWFYGVSICKGRSDCKHCCISDLCLHT